jgi:hypothetical protein
MTRYFLLFDICGLVFVGRPLWREDGSVFCICCWPLPAQSFSGPSPLELATVFYCLRLEAGRPNCLPYNHFARTEQKTPFQIVTLVVCVFVAVGTCLPIRCLETGYITPLFIRLLYSNGCKRYSTLKHDVNLCMLFPYRTWPDVLWFLRYCNKHSERNNIAKSN